MKIIWTLLFVAVSSANAFTLTPVGFKSCEQGGLQTITNSDGSTTTCCTEKVTCPTGYTFSENCGTASNVGTMKFCCNKNTANGG